MVTGKTRTDLRAKNQMFPALFDSVPAVFESTGYVPNLARQRGRCHRVSTDFPAKLSSDVEQPGGSQVAASSTPTAVRSGEGNSKWHIWWQMGGCLDVRGGSNLRVISKLLIRRITPSGSNPFPPSTRRLVGLQPLLSEPAGFLPEDIRILFKEQL